MYLDKDLFEAKKDYYFTSDTWKNLCNDKKASVNYRCECCGKVELYHYRIFRDTKKPFGEETIDDLQFLCEDCANFLKKKKQTDIQKKKKKAAKKEPKTCNNCFYSSIMKYPDKCKYYLWCNKKYDKCSGGICKEYKKGKYKKPNASDWNKYHKR